MGVIELATTAAERADVPDPVTRLGIALLVGRTNWKMMRADGAANRTFAEGMAAFPIAEHTEDANAQHYEVPSEFFDLVLGPQRKYSSCLYATPAATLAQAEETALSETAQHAGLADGQSILELGCGWGSLSLWMARTFPNARIVSVSNSQSQRAFIEARAAERQLRNLQVITADMNTFAAPHQADRVVSVEMFEHMANWRPLLERIRAWLTPEGRFFFHVFTHRNAPYRFDKTDKADWIAQHFFTGGIMPSHGLIREFGDLFKVEEEWRWNGEHYAHTARDWLANFDCNRTEIAAILRRVYSDEANIWARRWRLFLLATEGLFGHDHGEPWGISHYRLAPAP